MSKLFATTLLMCLVIASPRLVRAADAETPQDRNVRKLLEVSGAGKMGQQMFEAVIGQMKRIHPEVPQEFWSELSKQADFDAFLVQLIPVYEKHFTDDDILELIKFYESPIGKKLIHEQPLMIQETMPIGQAWGSALAQKIAAKMTEKGYLKH